MASLIASAIWAAISSIGGAFWAYGLPGAILTFAAVILLLRVTKVSDSHFRHPAYSKLFLVLSTVILAIAGILIFRPWASPPVEQAHLKPSGQPAQLTNVRDDGSLKTLVVDIHDIQLLKDKREAVIALTLSNPVAAAKVSPRLLVPDAENTWRGEGRTGQWRIEAEGGFSGDPITVGDSPRTVDVLFDWVEAETLDNARIQFFPPPDYGGSGVWFPLTKGPVTPIAEAVPQ